MEDVFVGVNWKEIFPRIRQDAGGGKNKFHLLARPLPLTTEFESNVRRTLDWLLRFGRNVTVSQSENPVLIPLKDNWFMSDIPSEKGVFYHLCDPMKFFQYHDRYTYHFNEFITVPRRQGTQGPHLGTARDMLWSMWNCLGKNFRFAEYTPAWMINELDTIMTQVDTKPAENVSFYTDVRKPMRDVAPFRCTRCPVELPKRARAMMVMANILD